MGRQSAMVATYGIFNGLMPVLLGMLFLPFMIHHTVTELPESMSVLGYFFGAPIHPGDHPGLKLRESWWIYYGMALLIGLSFLLWSLVGIVMRRVSRCAYPLPPPQEGGRPGCRVCGAELTGDGVVQRCDYCRADHIVIGGRYQRHARSIEQALDGMEAQLDTTLARRDRWGDRLQQLTMAASFGMFFVVPFVALYLQEPTNPALWWIPVVALALALVVDRLQRRWLPVPEIGELRYASAGEQMVVAGQAYTVVGRVVPEDTHQADKPIVLMLADGPEAEPSRAIVCFASDEANEQLTVRDVVSQVAQGNLSNGDPYRFKGAQGESPAHVEFPGLGDSRVIAEVPGSPGKVQTWTTRPSTLEAADVYLVQTNSR